MNLKNIRLIVGINGGFAMGEIDGRIKRKFKDMPKDITREVLMLLIENYSDNRVDSYTLEVNDKKFVISVKMEEKYKLSECL